MATPQEKSSKSALYIIIGVVFVASIALRLIDNFHLEQTSLLFIGLPTLIALLIVRQTGTPKSAYGIAFKAVTLFLLIASIAFGEGLVCILMAAPLFYGVTAILVAVYNYFQKDVEEENILHVSILIPLALVLGQATDFNKAPSLESVSVSKEISIASLDNLNAHPDFELNLPSFLQMGFPKPLSFEGQGLAVGDTREMKFESTTKGIGSLILEVEKVDKTTLIFNVVSDDSHIAHWLSWKTIEIKIEPINENKSTVTWTSYYTCDLAPHWYFGPLENFAVGLSNEHLINAFFEQLP